MFLFQFYCESEKEWITTHTVATNKQAQKIAKFMLKCTDCSVRIYDVENSRAVAIL